MRHLVPSALFLAAALSMPAPSQACSSAATYELAGYPSAGAGAVPTDVVLVYHVPSAASLGDPVKSATLSSGGTMTTVSVRLGNGSRHVELLPEQALAANTSYTLTVVWNPAPPGGLVTGSPETTLNFTTGAGPFVGPIEAPVVSLSHYRGASGTCSGSPNTCFGLPQDGWHLSRSVGSPWPYMLTKGPFLTNMYGAGQGHPFDCREIKARAPNGQLSAGTTICVTDGLMYDVTSLGGTPSCTPDGLEWNGEPIKQRIQGVPAQPSAAEGPAGGGADAGVPDAGANGGVVTQPAASAGTDPITNAATTNEGSPESDAGGCSLGSSRSERAWRLLALGVAAALCLRRRRRTRA